MNKNNEKVTWKLNCPVGLARNKVPKLERLQKCLTESVSATNIFVSKRLKCHLVSSIWVEGPVECVSVHPGWQLTEVFESISWKAGVRPSSGARQIPVYIGNPAQLYRWLLTGIINHTTSFTQLTFRDMPSLQSPKIHLCIEPHWIK